MDDLQRSEYPAMLASLQPTQTAQVVNERLKRIAKVNTEIADWLQERRRLEEQYVAGLKKLQLFKVPNPSSELGIFQPSWDKVLRSTDAAAASHQLFAQRVDKDVEQALRGFQNRKDVQNMQTMASNLAAMARELDDAREKSEKLSKKGGKASALKVDTAAARLEAASSQWESQAPFILETLQALDEQRCNHLRDVLTQFETHEVDQSDRLRAAANDVLATILEADTASEIDNFANRVTGGRARADRRTPVERTNTASRQSTSTNVPARQSTSTTNQPPSTADSALQPPTSFAQMEDNRSNHSLQEEKSESKLRSRIGTVFGRRRQSVHGGFGQLSPGKERGPFQRTSSSHGRLSPQASSSNIGNSTGRLDALEESPDTPGLPRTDTAATTNGANGTGTGSGTHANLFNGATAEEIFDAPPPPGPPPSHLAKQSEPAKDQDGFTIRPAADDPISQAQREAATEAGEDHDQPFKLNIQNSPIVEEDPDASKAALANVASSLSTLGPPARRTGTVRGRRDVRNTIYAPLSVPNPTADSLGTPESTQHLPPSPALQGGNSSMSSRPSAIHTLASEASVTGTSDTGSIRSATSLGSLLHGKHPELTAPGLNSSIIETVSASFEDGALKSVKINGEVAFAYNGDGMVSETRETIRINDFPSLDAIGPNRIFVSSTPAADEFTLDIAHIPAKIPTPGFTYRLHAEDPTSDLASHCPLIIHPAWKPTGDKLGLVLQYKLNPSFLNNTEPVQLKGVTFMATYEGARASGVQTKPTGTHLKEKHLIYWRLGDVTLQPGSDWQKIICRIIGAEKGEPQPGNIEARWEYATTSSTVNDDGSPNGISISRRGESKGKEKAVEDTSGEESTEDDPFADESAVTSPKPVNWQEVPLVRKIVSGKYEAK